MKVILNILLTFIYDVLSSKKIDHDKSDNTNRIHHFICYYHNLLQHNHYSVLSGNANLLLLLNVCGIRSEGDILLQTVTHCRYSYWNVALSTISGYIKGIYCLHQLADWLNIWHCKFVDFYKMAKNTNLHQNNFVMIQLRY